MGDTSLELNAPASLPVRPIVDRPRKVPVPWWSRWVYPVLTLVLIATVVRGFWASYFGPLVSGRILTRFWVIELHGAIFTGWMVLLLAQVLLVYSRRMRLHRRIGKIGIAYGATLLVMGLVVSFVAPVLHVRAGEWTLDRAAAFMLLPLGDMVLFGGFFAAAIVYRRKPEIHKRMILAATISIAFAAAARTFDSLVPLAALWFAPLITAMAADVFAIGRVHPANMVTGLVMVAAFLRILVMDSAAWLTVGRALLGPFI